MEDQAYNISRVSRYVFKFPSIGKKQLLKQVSFSGMKYNPDVYNLALGTVLENGTVNFQDNSNNGDLVKVFSTVIKCIKIFTDDFPGKIIFFKGNTVQKTRVYNEIIRRHYDEFSVYFNIFGVNADGSAYTIDKFDCSKNYSGGFYLKVKI